MTGSSDRGAPRWPDPPLHVVTDDRIFAAPDFLATAAEVLEACGAGVVLHLRAPGATGRALHDAAVRLVRTARRTGSRVLVNGRVDVALTTGADGAQLPAQGLPCRAARRLLGPRKLVGASVHSEEEARSAVSGGASFLLVGTIFQSASHPGRAAAGVDAIRALLPFRVPVIGIGGITCDRARTVLEAGAAGVAVRGAIWDAGHPAHAAAEVLKAVC